MRALCALTLLLLQQHAGASAAAAAAGAINAAATAAPAAAAASAAPPPLTYADVWSPPWWYNLRASRAVRVAVRGSWHALRDVLFPSLRRALAPDGGSPRADSSSPPERRPAGSPLNASLDWALPDEAAR